jgi:hypothetical protein
LLGNAISSSEITRLAFYALMRLLDVSGFTLRHVLPNSEVSIPSRLRVIVCASAATVSVAAVTDSVRPASDARPAASESSVERTELKAPLK